MRIHQNFTGGNIRVVRQEDHRIWLENELRDTVGDWFYWAFCVEGAMGQTLTFHFGEKRLGYFGPAVSHDLRNWEWVGGKDGNSFTYTFSEDEQRVYFAHHMLYHPDRFEEFCDGRGLKILEFCRSEKDRKVPSVEFGEGKSWILLTARHHACESTGNYVLEGVLEEFLIGGVPDGFRVLCVPFVDLDGVVDGDQGKNRKPHDHNRDYEPESEAVYESVRTLRRFILEHRVAFGFDFHSPWHLGGSNDRCFIVQKLTEHVEELNRFGEFFESEITWEAFSYRHRDDYPLGVGWNQPGTPSFAPFIMGKPEAELAFTLETAYFGTESNVFAGDKAKETGRCFVRALRAYLAEKTKERGRDAERACD
ncbi:MAG: hypothetical protein HFG75_11175 [Hungatella sp.]|nr:hypothetical protein [Hungatella sp.]